MNWQADTFWQFSLEVYEREGVAEALIDLQDSYQANVNLCLLCAFVQRAGSLLERDQLEALVQSLESADARLIPLRSERRAIKQTQPQRYKALLSQELELERQQQQDLIDTLNRMTIRQDKQDVISFYLNHLQVPENSFDELYHQLIREQE